MLSASIICLSLMIYHEARGENEEVMFAVKQALINRSIDRDSTICNELFRPKQFTWTSNFPKYNSPAELDFIKSDRFMKKFGIKEKDAWLESIKISITKSSDISNGGTHFSTNNPNTGWRGKLKKTAKVGPFVFFKEG